MSDPILHHFDPSPFAEKIRLALGLKGLDWHSVQIPMIMPKPDLTALTGGYRKTPVLQFGADVYCDTGFIAQELERRYPSPSLFPAGSESVALALGSWSDVNLFRAGAALSMGTNAQLPGEVLEDRVAFFDFLEASDLEPPLDRYFAQFVAGLRRLDQMLRDGRPWLLGDAPGWADLACYTPVWMCRGNIAGAEELLGGMPDLVAWEARVAAIGHGNRRELDAADALGLASRSGATSAVDVRPDAWPRLSPGAAVSVAPDDYGRDPSVGSLRRLTHETVAIDREDERAGAVTVHFPRLGYRVEAVER